MCVCPGRSREEEGRPLGFDLGWVRKEADLVAGVHPIQNEGFTKWHNLPLKHYYDQNKFH